MVDAVRPARAALTGWSPGKVWLAVLPALLTFNCAAPQAFQARIRRTSYNIPHIEARDVGSLGFGEGYAQAEDHLCSIADQMVRVRGERSRYFGPGGGNRHFYGDVAMKGLGVYARASEHLRGQDRDYRDWLAGFAAGYNHYLAETGRDAVPGWCTGEGWVVPISTEDIAAYLYMVTLTTTRFAGVIGSAQPPNPDDAQKLTHGLGSPFSHSAPSWPEQLDQASNGWAIGSKRSETAGGLLVANPHFPWVGSNRFWEKHLAIRGKLDVYGASLLGVPGVAIGFNKAVAWTHTVSAGKRFTLYRLDLLPGKPTTYRYGNGEREMTVKTVSVDVRLESGEVRPYERKVYFSHHGPVIALPGVGWTAEHALAVRDANWDNDEAGPQWFAMNRAGSLDEFIEAHARFQGMPFVNTIAVSADGRAWYADTAATPNLRPDVVAAWKEQLESDDLVRNLGNRRMVVLDGGDPTADWLDDPAARDPGVVPYEAMPRLERRDYVFNANDSFWLANSSELITGPYSALHGDQGTALSLRTRNNDLTLSNRSPDQPAGADGRFSLDEALDAILSNRSYTAELIRTALVERCQERSIFSLDTRSVDLSEACAVLGSWDGRYDLDSRGAVVFREFISRYPGHDLRGKGSLFDRDFDPVDPVGTPHRLADADTALENLARAVELLKSRDTPLDVPLGEVQYTFKAGRRIPVHGGQGSHEGLLNALGSGSNSTTLEPMRMPKQVEGSRFLSEQGYPIAGGTSFLLGVEYTAEGHRAKGILTYSQSGDPASPHFSDQTELFSQKKLRPVLFDEADIAADAQLEYTVRVPRRKAAR